MNKISLFLAMFLFSGIANAEMLNSKHIYSFAKSGDYRSLGRYSRWIDITNSDGDTAVCLAIRNNDINSYNLLLSYGANSRPSCYASAIKSASGSAKDGTFLGMSGTGWAVTGGVLAAGGIAAAAGGGGGGGSGSSSSQPDQVVCSNHGSLVDGACQCNSGYTGSQCETCDDGYTKYNGSCYKKLACNANQHQEANNCVCDNNYIEQNGTCYQKLSCINGSQNKNECICDFGYTGSFCNEADENHIIGSDGNLYDKLNCVNGSQVNASCNCADGWSGATCETAITCDYDTVECAYGYKETGNTCKSGNTTYKECVFDADNYIEQEGVIYLKLQCQNGGVQIGNECSCVTGYSGKLCNIKCLSVDEDGNCIKVGTTNKTNKSTIKATNNDKSITLYGMKGEVYAYNAYGDTKGDHGTNGTITLINKNAGDVYGMYSGIFATNTHVGYPNHISGLIDIKNTNSGNVYGIYSDGKGVNVEGYAAGTYDTGIIRINNVNSGDAYGIYVTKSSGISANYAANSSGGGLAIIEITNRGNNNIYGIYSGDTAVNNGIANGYGGQGIVKINNIGNGDIYGIFAEYSAHNTGTSDNDRYTGTIKIKNQGNGKVYGIFAEYSENNSNDLIQIISDGITNSYGMYGTSHNSNFGTIQIVQTDNGLAVGQYGSGYLLNSSYTSGRIYNRGTIKVYNLSNGFAVGIYANYAKVENLGDIIITRADFTDDNLTKDDTSDDITYSAATEKGGTAIGIYGTKDSNITNTGTITINNATNAYGIWSEGGTVTNTGTITIDGDAKTNDSTANGKHIVLNGGTLLQDGRLVAGADLSKVTCAEGYVDFNGICYEKMTCETNRHQEADKCVCDGGYIEQNGVCYVELNCGHGFQNKDSCVCEAGYAGSYCNTCASGYIDQGGICYADLKCQHGYQNKNTCVCETGYAGTTCGTCADGYVNLNGVCYAKLTCGMNQHQEANACVCDSGYIKQDGVCYAKLTCGENKHQDKNSCVCDSGYIEQGGVCYVELTCGTNQHQEKNSCICDSGYIMREGSKTCIKSVIGSEEGVNNDSINIINRNDDDIYGMYGDFEKTGSKAIDNASEGKTGSISIDNIGNGYIYGMFYNMYADNASGTNSVGTIDIINEGSGNVYGLFVLGQACNAFGKSSTGTINVKNKGIGNVYGMYSSGMTFNAGGENSTGNIDISNEGDGNVYGIYGEDYAHNSSNGTGGITINNKGNGKVYGIYGGNYVYNSSSSKDTNLSSKAIINIDNDGTGDIYGMYGKNYVSNSSADSGGSDGIIRISNNNKAATNDIYGMYSGDYAYSAGGTGNSSISIINLGQGNTYGLYGVSTSNYASDSTQAILEIVNAGDGLAVGMYGKKSVDNSGTIKIHNLGDGTAIGMYADADGVTVTNSGNITIDRKSYTDDNLTKDDTSDDTTYSASTEKGGKAIGIYGTKGSTITNSGTITINNMANAYGIWSEGGTVTNTGTIVIDGDAKTNDSTANGKHIVLNGGTLLQDGRLVAGADLSQVTCADGYINLNGTCYVDLNCGPNSHQEENSCVCTKGYIYQNGSCYAELTCGRNKHQEANACVCDSGYIEQSGVCFKEISCKEGETQYGDFCVGSKTLKRIHKEDIDHVEEEENASAIVSANGESIGAIQEINVLNINNANIQGTNSYNAYTSNNSTKTFAQAEASGKINITNIGNGNVIGSGDNNAEAICTSNCQENQYVTSIAKGYINISNYGDGTVIGTKGSNAISSLGEAIGTINIRNNGSGNVFGAKGSNAIANDGSATGTIDIINNGSGSVFGLYSDNAGDIYNAKSSAGNASGTISITNNGTGNVYGMFGIGGANLYNLSDYKTTSKIEIANIGDGLAVGMYGKKSVDNSGTIKIHNLSNGIAIGMYADADGGIVTNSGEITIDREDSKKGGTAIGIYGAKRSKIINSGTIIINNAANAYGIWSEGGSVTNTGTITIDGDAKTNDSTANGKHIVLNGGTLLQDGRLVAGADSSQVTCAEGYVKQNGICYAKLTCGHGYQEANSCICDSGYVMIGATCAQIVVGSNNEVNNDAINITNSDDKYVYGIHGSTRAYNAKGTTSTGNITISNEGNGEVCGIFADRAINAYNEGMNEEGIGETSGTIDITNKGNGIVYGIYSSLYAYNVDGRSSTGNITISNEGDGDVHGIFGDEVTNAYDDSEGYDKKTSGMIDITNNGNGDVFGLYGTSRANNAEGDISIATIKISNKGGTGDVYGMFGNRIFNVSGDSGESLGTIDINNNSYGNVYGMYGKELAQNSRDGGNNTGIIRISNNNKESTGNVYGIYSEGEAKSVIGDEKSLISIINQGHGNTYGLYGKHTSNGNGENVDYDTTLATLEIINTGDGLAVGMYGKESVDNSGTIKIHNLGDGTSVGIYADGGTVTNSGNITIDRESYTDDNLTKDDTSDDTTYSAATEKGGAAIGIYGTKDSNITNTGTITINNATNAYGIWSEGGTVTNTGTITIDGDAKTNDSTANGKHIVLNGGTLLQDGRLVATQTSNTANSSSISTLKSKKINNYVLNLDDMGGKVVATEKAVFEVNGAIAGHLTMSSDIVSKGFKDTYTTNGTIDAEDTSGLCLVSQSALFNASLAENNSDVVMKMKSFDKVVDNKSLAGFLQSNYALENNELFFNTLKKQETKTSLNNALDDLSGKKLFSRFADEDLTMMRELTFDVNNKLFMNNDDHLETSGNISTFNFSSNKGSDNRYALISQNYGNYKLGLNYGFANVRSDDDDNNRRNERMFHIGMPISYGKQGFKFITTPHLGYSSGTYNRKGFNNENYEGNVEKTMFGLVNEARYPFTLGKWTIAPGAEFNVVDYRTQGHEKGGTYKLRLASQNNYSVEAGVGLYANAEHKFSEKSKLTFTNGLTMYHEFADPYKMQVGVYKMSGKFDIRDEKRSDNRAVIRTGLSYVNDNISLSGNVMSYVDKEYRTNAVLDFKYAF